MTFDLIIEIVAWLLSANLLALIAWIGVIAGEAEFYQRMSAIELKERYAKNAAKDGKPSA